MITMHWTPKWLRCGAGVCAEAMLGDLPENEYCKNCDQANDIDSLDTSH
jgi:hypothetical protein